MPKIAERHLFPSLVIAHLEPKELSKLPLQGFVRLPTILKLIPVSRSLLLDMVARGEFPPPVKLSRRVSAWRCEDVLAYIASRSA